MKGHALLFRKHVAYLEIRKPGNVKDIGYHLTKIVHFRHHCYAQLFSLEMYYSLLCLHYEQVTHTLFAGVILL